MLTFIWASRSKSLLLPSLSQNYHSNSGKSLLPLITFYPTLAHNRAFSSTPDSNAKISALANCLIDSFKLAKDRAVFVSRSFSYVKSLEKPKEVVHFLKGLGLSDAQIQSIAYIRPQVLFADVERSLKPKVIFFQELGLLGPSLCTLISKNPRLLTMDLDRSLKPCIHLIKKVHHSDGRCKSKERGDHVFLRMLTRLAAPSAVKMEANITYLASCGVVGSQMSKLMVSSPRLFDYPKEKLEELVSRVVDMKFTKGSRMMAPAIQILSCLSIETLNGRFEVFRMFGFSKDEIASMFRSTPQMFGLSEEKLSCKLEFFLNNLKVDKLMLVRNPVMLGFNLEGRVIPRCKVVEILKSRGLLKDFPLVTVLQVSDKKFLEKYILPYKDEAENLLLEAYKGKLVDTCEI